MSSNPVLPPPAVLRHVIDVHCHPTDSETPDDVMGALNMNICAMGTRSDDQERVKALAEAWPEKVTPCFGYHPWFTHMISLLDEPPSKNNHYRSILISSDSPTEQESAALDEVLQHLPEPRSLCDILSEVRANLTAFPKAMLGEVGLDRAFRIPCKSYPSPSPRKLTPFTVPLQHQLTILEAQLDLAVELARDVSLHSVKCQGATVELLRQMKKKHGAAWDKINIDFHSCGMSAETWREVEKGNVNTYLSLSMVINGRSSGLRGLVQACSPNRLLVESDYHDINLCTAGTWEMVLLIADVKGWSVEDRWDEEPDEPGVVRRLEQNWREFRSGRDKKDGKKEKEGFTRRQRKLRDYSLDEMDSEEEKQSET